MMATRKVISPKEAAEIIKDSIARRRERPLTVAHPNLVEPPQTPAPAQPISDQHPVAAEATRGGQNQIDAAPQGPTVRKHPVNPRVVTDSALSQINGFGIAVHWHGTGVALLDFKQMVQALANLAQLALEQVSGQSRRVAFELRNDASGLTIRLAHQGRDNAAGFRGTRFMEALAIIGAHGGTLNISDRRDGGHDVLIRIPRGPNGTGPNR